MKRFPGLGRFFYPGVQLCWNSPKTFAPRYLDFRQTKDEKRTCSSKVNLAANSLALSIGRSNEKTFLPVMASSDGEFCSGVVAGVSIVTGCTWIVACFSSICRRSPCVGLAISRFIVAMVNLIE
jgi:hypothetical protein